MNRGSQWVGPDYFNINIFQFNYQLVPMKRTCLLLTTWILAAVAALACDVTFIPSAGDVGTNDGTAAPFIVEKEGITLSISNGLANDAHYRVYKGQTLTICSLLGNITDIVIYCTAHDDNQYGPGCFDVTPGGYSYAGNVGEWHGSAECVTFAAVTNQVRITRIDVTYDCGEGLRAPVISPASGTYYDPIAVSMTCRNSEAQIYYTVDGSQPTTGSTLYTTPFTVSSNVTVKAISALDNEVSEVAIASYEFAQALDVNCLADAMNYPDGSVLRFLNPVYVTACNRNYLFVKDSTAFALIYGPTGQTYKHGDVIPGGFVLTKSFYSGEIEFTQPKNFAPATSNVPIEAEEMDNLPSHDMWGHYVVVHNVHIVKEGNGYVAIDEDGNEYPIYFGTLGVTVPADLSVTYDLYAIVGSYVNADNVIYQLLPVKLVRTTPEPLIGFGDLPFLVNDPENPTTDVTMGYDAIVLYQYNNYLYAKDETGYGMVYGPTGQTYKPGDVIPAGFGGLAKLYDCQPEITQPTGFEPAKGYVELVPEEITLSEVDEDHWGHYVVIKHVAFDPESRVLRDSEGNEIPYYNRFNVELPTDLGQLYDIYGIVAAYGRDCIYELLITDFGPKPDPGLFNCLEDFYTIPQGTVGEFSVPLVVVYQNGAYLYVKDMCDQFGLIYGDVGGTFVNGDSIIGLARWTTYQGAHQLYPVESWHLVGHGPEIQPEQMPVEEVFQDMVHWYIYFEDVKIVIGDDGYYYIEDETGRLRLFDKFYIDIIDTPQPSDYIYGDVNWDNEVNIADVNAIIDYILAGGTTRHALSWSPDDINPNATYDIWGFLTIYRDEMELFPIKIVRHGTGEGCFVRRYDVNDDGEVTIADVNLVIDYILSH